MTSECYAFSDCSDPIRIYGKSTTIPDFLNDSTEEDLSDDENLVKFIRNSPVTTSDESESDLEKNVALTQIPCTSSCISRKAKPRWRDGFLAKIEKDTEFTLDTSLPAHIMELETPLQFFKYLFTDDMFQHITQETLRYATEKRPEKPMCITEKEIEQFVGVCMMMSIIQLPATRYYWSSVFGYPKVNSVMSSKRFEEIKRYIHFNENSTQVLRGQPGYDPVHKLRPLLNQVGERLLTVPRERYLTVTEHIIPTKCRYSLKKHKPKHPLKLKNFALSGSSGFTYDFELYTDALVPETVDDDLPNFGFSSNVVLRLAKTIPENLNYSLFFDSRFTSLPLLVYLSKKKILPLGIIKANHLTGYKIPLEILKKKGRGATVEKLTTIDNTDISVTTWYDNRVVNLSSTYEGSQPMTEVRRYNKKKKVYESVPCPKAIATYTKHSGGVDLDALLGYYRIQIKSKKLYHRIFFHLIDMTTVNAWLLYRQKHDGAKARIPLSDFKAAVAEALTMANKTSTSSNCGPNSNPLQLAIEVKRRGATARPSQDVRLDQLDHFPIWTPRRRCKLPGCTGFTHVECKKCKVHLCLTDRRNCFLLFHTK